MTAPHLSVKVQQTACGPDDYQVGDFKKPTNIEGVHYTPCGQLPEAVPFAVRHSCSVAHLPTRPLGVTQGPPPERGSSGCDGSLDLARLGMAEWFFFMGMGKGLKCCCCCGTIQGF